MRPLFVPFLREKPRRARPLSQRDAMIVPFALAHGGTRDVARALKYIDLADGLQPNDPYILQGRATVHANRDSRASAP